MNFSALRERSYDIFGLSVFAVSAVVVLPTFTVATPLFAIPVIGHTALKTAYHASRFFLEKRYDKPHPHTLASLIEQKKTFTKQDLPFLIHEQKKLYHKGRMAECLKKIQLWLWGLIPVYGVWILSKKLNSPTDLSAESIQKELAFVNRTILLLQKEGLPQPSRHSIRPRHHGDT